MGANQSAESRRIEDAKYQAMLKNALEQQRKNYEAKCKELLQEQQKKTYEAKCKELLQEQKRKTYEAMCKELLQEKQRIEATKEHNARTVPQISVKTQRDSATLYPSLQQVSTVQTQASTSSVFYNAHLNNTQSQNKSILDPVPNRLQFPQPVPSPLQQNATSTTSYNTTTRRTNSIDQNKPPSIASFDCQPSAPIAPTAPEISSKPRTVQQKQKPTGKPKKDDTYLCPSCKVNILDTAIYQCLQGHSSCDKCKMKAVKCGICNANLTNTRNIELERMLANLPKNNVKYKERVYCPNKSDGCMKTVTPDKLQGHLKCCIFREMECPIASANYIQCSWRGKINQIPAHILECHPNQAGASEDTENIFNRDINNYVIHHIVIGNFNFLVHIKLDNNLQTFFMAVQLIGTLFEATKWSYEFHVYEKSEPRRKFTYVDACLSNSIPFSESSKENKCAALPLHYALSFFKDNTMTYKFYIKRDESITCRRRYGKNMEKLPTLGTQIFINSNN